MSLYAAWVQLADEFNLLSGSLGEFSEARISISSSADFTLKDECTLEGLLSRVWQAWCTFCRSCVVESCLGAKNGLGVVVPQHPSAISADYVSGAAIRAKSKGTPPIWGTSNSLLRKEPTWGDVDVLTTIIPLLNPANKTQLLAAFSSGSRSAKALQLIRNASAHHNPQTLSEVNSIRSRYVVFPIKHPIQALYWVDPSSRDFLVNHAIEELLDTGLSAIS